MQSKIFKHTLRRTLQISPRATLTPRHPCESVSIRGSFIKIPLTIPDSQLHLIFLPSPYYFEAETGYIATLAAPRTPANYPLN